MTNGWIDIKNTDMMLIMGGNPAENHPCGFKWAIEAKRNRNAKMIVVDPRFTRTAANADLFLQIRAGSDIAFLGGLINYAIENNRIAHEYLVNYTNAAFIMKDGFKLPEDGLYLRLRSEKQDLRQGTWNYEAGRQPDRQGAAATLARTAHRSDHASASGAQPAAHRHALKARAIRRRVRRARRHGRRADSALRRCRRTSLTISRCSIRAASSNC